MKNTIKKFYNCEREGNVNWLGYGLLWAAVILLGSWLSRDSQHAESLNMMLIGLSTVGFLATDRRNKTK